jgi:hypothetical protein
MAYGPGKYDAECTMIRELTNARGVIVLVVGGDRGGGFSCQGDLDLQLRLPMILEDIARQMRESLQ